MDWIKVKDKLPTYDSQQVLFVRWIQLDSKDKEYPPLMGCAYADNWKGVKDFRTYDLKNNFTHWKSQGKPPKS